MKKLIIFIEEISHKRAAFLSLVLASLILLIDYVTGEDIYFPIMYVIPVGIAAWKNQKFLGYAMSIMMPTVRSGFYFIWPDTGSFLPHIINTMISILALTGYTYLIDRISYMTKEMQKEIKILEGILPICASCKKIRNEKGEYEQIEQYIMGRSEATFTHGYCQECAKIYLPEDKEE